MTKRTAVSILCVAGLLAGLGLPVKAFPRGQDAAAPQVSVNATPAALVLLASTMDAAAIEAAARAIASDNPLARTVAARMLGVAGHAPSAGRIATAFESEQDSAAAVEQARALLFIRGAAAVELIERRLNTAGYLAIPYADWIARTQPERLAGLLPRLSSSLGGDGPALSTYVYSALDKQPDGGEQLLRASLSVITPSGWRALIDRIPFDARPHLTPVFIEALAVPNPALREATVWSLATALVQGRTVPAAALDAATSDIGSVPEGPADGASAWERFGREMIARQHLQKLTPDRSELIKAEAGRHRSDARKLEGTKHLVDAERKALRAVVGDPLPRLPPRGHAAPVGERSGIPMRTLPVFWPGLLKSVLDAANCKARGNQVIALTSVTYRADGRVARVLVNNNPLPSGCVTAVFALSSLTLADMEYPPPANSTEWLVLPLDDDYIACASSAEAFAATRSTAVGPHSSMPTPRKTRDVEPVYPASLLSGGRQGIVFMEGIITAGGCMANLRVMHSPELLFSFAALRAVSGWRFTPTRVDNRNVPVSMDLTVNFTLQ